MAAVVGQVTKRRRNGEQKQREDRLSSLHDDILIRILSTIPIDLAIVTGCLSRRWRGLWTNVTSIKIPSIYSPRYRDFSTVIDKIMKGMTSLFVHTFIVEYTGWFSLDYLDSWLRQVCDRNVRVLKVISEIGSPHYVFSLSSYIFQTRSLVSLELDTRFCWQLPDDGPDLPNLKTLSVNLFCVDWEWLERLVKSCMSLEELSIKSQLGRSKDYRYFKCSNNNVTRLILKFGFREYDKVVIDTPKLKYLSICGPKYNLFSFESEPIALWEVEIKNIANPHPLHSSASVGLRCVTRLTLHMAACYDSNFGLTLVNSCPVLDVLTLQLDTRLHGNYNSRPVGESTSLRGIKRIEIEASWIIYCIPMDDFLELVKYLLGNARDLEHVRFKVVGEDTLEGRYGSVESKQKRELDVCKRLYKYPIVSIIGCEVEFVGWILNMSRKAGPKAWRRNGEVIPFDTNTHKKLCH